MRKRRTIFLVLLLCAQSVCGQTIFDQAEDWLKNHRMEINYGPQWAWYKYSRMRLVQPYYNRDVVYKYVEATDNPNMEYYLKGEWGVPQFTLNVSVDLSNRYSMFLDVTHLSYVMDVGRKYHRNGQWNGSRVHGYAYMYEEFNTLEHSNGLNLWSVGLLRNFATMETNGKKYVSRLGLGLQTGPVLTATQGAIKNPQGFYESYDPGNTLAGVSYGGRIVWRNLFWDRVILQANFVYFQTVLSKARLDESAYIQQKIRGSHYGMTLGYKIGAND